MNSTNSFSFNNAIKSLLIFLLVFSVQLSNAQTVNDGLVTAQLRHSPIINKADNIEIVLELQKHNISGYAKLSVIIDQEYTLIKKNIQNAAISQKDSIISILWIEIGTLPEMSISIELAPKSENNSSKVEINGAFSYIFNNHVRKINFPASRVELTENKIDRSSIVESSSTENTNIIIDTLPESKDNNLLLSDIYSKDQKKLIENNKDLRKEPSYADLYNDNIVFKVQIAASRRRLSEDKLRNIYSNTNAISEEIHSNGWYKYYIGNFATYQNAHNEKMQCGVPDAFIVAQSGGKNINIVEALRNSDIIHNPHKQIVYKIQIAAHQKMISKWKIKRLYKLENNISIEFHQNMNKYTTGEFFNYEQAQAFKKHLHIVDAFIVAYKNGERIDIREARNIENK